MEYEDVSATSGGEAGVTTRRSLLVALAAGTALAGCVSDDEEGTGDDDPDEGEPDENNDPGDDKADTADEQTGQDPGEYEIPAKGDPDTDVTLAVFSDFACPACAAYATELFPDVEREYLDTGRIRYEHRDLPLPVADPGSWQAANAAREVYESEGTEAFWTYKLALLERYDEIGDGTDLFADIADELGLDSETIEAAARERPHDEVIEAERDHALSLGVTGTPGFVVDGKPITEGQTLQEVVDAVMAELDAALDGESGGESDTDDGQGA